MEKRDIYNKSGQRTGRVADRNEPLQEGEFIIGASLWIVSSGGLLLIQKRSMEKSYAPGMWSITGGATLAGETSKQACIREVAEEIGVLFSLDDIELLRRSYGYRQQVIFDDFIAIRDISLQDCILQADEVSEVKWASLTEIRDMYKEGSFSFNDAEEFDHVAQFISSKCTAEVSNNA